ncbi:MAG: aspartate aminotransferase family protein [Planctomycetes bacterium]|nr:aspartate aminotransferase family protein [Planctomycetota bacterium]
MPSHKTRTPLPESTHEPAAYHGPTRDEMLAMRREYLNPAVMTLYREPTCIIEGKKQYVWDESGKRYLDAFAGIATISVGHAHPKIVERAREQIGRLAHTTTLYLHPLIGQYAEKLADHFPTGSSLNTTYFTNSGSEANDLAVLMSRVKTGTFDVIALENAYHGGTQSTMALTGLGTWKYPVPHQFGVHFAAPGYCYRCPFGLEYPSCDLRCAKSVADLIRHRTPERIACFIGEPIQGVGGVVDPPPDYFKIVYQAIRACGGLCIADEVQTGWGRTGDHFWGFENWDVVPDIVTMAKGIANGAPLGACTTRPEIAGPMAQRCHFNTFAGNPVSMVQGLTTLEIIDEENLQENSRRVGGHLKDRLLELKETHPIVGDVRGKGLMLGIELVDDRKTKTPATEATKDVLELARDRGLLLGKGGYYGNVLRITPPMCITTDDADFIADCLDEVFAIVQTDTA